MSTGIDFASLFNQIATTDAAIVRGKFNGSQLRRAYEPFTTLLESAKGDARGTGWQKNFHTGPNAGATRGILPYEDVAPQRSPAQRQLTDKWVIISTEGIVYDMFELYQNQGAGADQIVDMMVADEEAVAEDQAEFWAAMTAGVGIETSSDTKHTKGILYYARRSINSSGTFVANATGGWTGQYVTLADATTISTMMGQDTTLEANKRLRNFNITHDNTFGVDHFNQIRIMNSRLKFSPFKGRNGDMVTGGHVTWWNTATNDAYIKIINDGPDDRGRGGALADLFPFTQGSIGGVPVKVCEFWDDLVDNPAVSMRKGALKLSHFPNSWFTPTKPIMVNGSYHTFYKAQHSMAQLLAEYGTREGLGICHGPLT